MYYFLLSQTMRRVLYIFLTFFAVFITSSALSRVKVSAASVGEVKTITGTLKTNPNPKYTNKVDGINLRLNSTFQKLVGQNVQVKVKYVTSTRFTVVSVKKAAASEEASEVVVHHTVTPAPAGSHTFQGRFTQSPFLDRDYRITATNGTAVDLIVGGNLNAWIGKQVIMTYMGTLNSFRIVSLRLV